VTPPSGDHTSNPSTVYPRHRETEVQTTETLLGSAPLVAAADQVAPPSTVEITSVAVPPAPAPAPAKARHDVGAAQDSDDPTTPAGLGAAAQVHELPPFVDRPIPVAPARATQTPGLGHATDVT